MNIQMRRKNHIYLMMKSSIAGITHGTCLQLQNKGIAFSYLACPGTILELA